MGKIKQLLKMQILKLCNYSQKEKMHKKLWLD